jgi:hypothetical protein
MRPAYGVSFQVQKLSAKDASSGRVRRVRLFEGLTERNMRLDSGSCFFDTLYVPSEVPGEVVGAEYKSSGKGATSSPCQYVLPEERRPRFRKEGVARIDHGGAPIGPDTLMLKAKYMLDGVFENLYLDDLDTTRNSKPLFELVELLDSQLVAFRENEHVLSFHTLNFPARYTNRRIKTLYEKINAAWATHG